MPIFKISQIDIERSSTLTIDDLDQYCFLIKGTYQGFYDTFEQASIAKSEIISDVQNFLGI